MKKHLSEGLNLRLGVILSYVILAVQMIGNIFVTPHMLNAIGDSNYGLYSFVTSITNWMTVITAALASAYVRFATIEKKEAGTEKRVTSIFVTIFGLFSIVLFLLGCLILTILYFSGFTLDNYTPEQNDVLYVLFFLSCLNVAVTIFFNSFNLQLTFIRKFVWLRISSLFVALGTVLANLIVPLFTDSIIVLVIVYVCLTLVNGVLVVLVIFKNNWIKIGRVSLKENSALVRQIVVFSSFVLFNSVVDQINSNMDKTILGLLVDSSAVTIYQLSHTFNASLTTMSTAISSVFVPKINQLIVQDNRDELNRLFLKVSYIQLFVLCFIIGGFFACGNDFVLLWLGSKRIAVFQYACALTGMALVPLSVNLGIEIQRGMNKHKFRAILYFVLALVNVAVSVGLVYLLPEGYEIWGCIVGTAFSNIVGVWVILNIYNWKVIGLPMGTYFLSCLQMIGLTALCIIPSLAIGSLVNFDAFASFLLEGVIFICIFFVAFFSTFKSAFHKTFGKKRSGRCLNGF